MYVEITGNPSPKDGVEVGDVFEAKPYWLDPNYKRTLIRKVRGSKKRYATESMNFYKSDCRRLTEEEVSSFGFE